MEIKSVNTDKTIDIADSVFACRFNEALIHQVVVAYMAKARAGTKAQKTRAEVSGGGAKPWRQKGTGRARAGTIRSPIWRKGGVTFAARPRNYEQKVNKKMYRGALRSIVSELVRQDRFIVVDAIDVAEAKTKLLKQHLASLSGLNLNQKILLITDSISENLFLSGRNLSHLAMMDASLAVADPVTLISADKVLITEAALKEMEGLLQ
jgi:large subunit ribosomal protein L4